MYFILLESFFFLILGAIVGSFLNVVAFRYNTGVKVTGRSTCLSCSRKLRWYELIPVLSFLFLRGSCGGCKSRISWQYPLVELCTAILFLLVYLKGFSVPNIVYLFIIFSLLVVIFVYDMKHTIIPDGLVYTFIILSGAKLFLDYPVQELLSMPGLLNLLAGPILFLPFFILWAVSRGRWMGFGDGKLAWGIGWFLGLEPGATAIILGFFLGAVVGICILALRHFAGKNIKSEIPFAPFLILGTLIVLFVGLNFSVFENILVW